MPDWSSNPAHKQYVYATPEDILEAMEEMEEWFREREETLKQEQLEEAYDRAMSILQSIII